MYVHIIPTRSRRFYAVTGRTKSRGRDKGGFRNNGGIQPYKKVVSEQRRG